MSRVWRDVHEHTAFTREFKEEGVKPVTERGYPMADISARVGFPATAWTRQHP